MITPVASEKARNSEKHERFMALLTPCLARLSRYSHAMTKDGRSFGEDGRDLLSDAILIAYENFEDLRAPEAFTSYIFTTARRLYYRRARRKRFWGVLGSEAEAIADERAPSPETKLDLEALDRALLALPEKQREAVVLFEISELSLKEIREIQGGSLSGVKSRIVRGREKLAELLGEREQMRTSASPGGQAGTPVRQQPGTAAPHEAAPRGAGSQGRSSFQRIGSIALIKEKI